jgi:hypothetical protein
MGNTSSFRDTSSKPQFDEYDAGDWEDGAGGDDAPVSKPPPKSKPAAEAPKQPVKEVNLFDDWDEPVAAPAAAPAAKQPAAASLDGQFRLELSLRTKISEQMTSTTSKPLRRRRLQPLARLPPFKTSCPASTRLRQPQPSPTSSI